VGRALETTNGPAVVAKSSGKGWVVVETASGGSYRMRLSQLWDYTAVVAAEEDGAKVPGPPSGGVSGVYDGGSGGGGGGRGMATTASGFALPLPAQRAGDPGMPKNWSFSLLKKRVQTNQGVGVVTDVIDKGWIGVRLEGGRKIKTRPGNVTALEGDDVITSFAKKTKAIHANKPPVLLPGKALPDLAAAFKEGEYGGGSADDDTAALASALPQESSEAAEAAAVALPKLRTSKRERKRPQLFVAKRTLSGPPRRLDSSSSGSGGGSGGSDAASVGGGSQSSGRSSVEDPGWALDPQAEEGASGGAGVRAASPKEGCEEGEAFALGSLRGEGEGRTGGGTGDSGLRSVLSSEQDLLQAAAALQAVSSLPPAPSLEGGQKRRRVPALQAGTDVQCRVRGHSDWLSGVIEYEHDDGTYSIILEHGEVVSHVPRSNIRG